MLVKYAQLLCGYCLDLQPGDRFLIKAPSVAEPLLREVFREAVRRGARPYILASFEGFDRIWLEEASEDQLKTPHQFDRTAMEDFEAFLNIRAPFNLVDPGKVDKQKRAWAQQGNKPITEAYFRRLGSGELKRSLCQYPTNAAAQEAGMSLAEYSEFVFNACYLDDPTPEKRWLEVREFQQGIVDHLNTCTQIRYVGEGTDISFNTKGRKWINSDGRNNMPSGEVFTSPVEDSVEGHIRYAYPAIYMGRTVDNVRLEVKGGQVVNWEADRGRDFLDEIFAIPGARVFGEAAIGTNMRVQQHTRNILFDEKIGGTVHMAIGQSYLQCGGKNTSTVHWDMIADMKNGGQIFADGKLIYESGKFLI